MVKLLFAIQDVKASFFSAPFVCHNEGEARRMLIDAVGDSQTLISRHPEDFRLFKIGEFDDNSGGLSPVAQPEFIVNAVDCVVKDVKE